jgi:hypothetical protein
LAIALLALLLAGCGDAARAKAEADRAAALAAENAALRKETADLKAQLVGRFLGGGDESGQANAKKAAPKSLVEEAQLLGKKKGEWISEEPFIMILGKEEEKAHLTFRFEPEEGKPSGEAWLGTMYSKLISEGKDFKIRSGSRNAVGGYTFELVERDGKRAINLVGGPSTVIDGKSAAVQRPSFLQYSLDGDKLMIDLPLEQWLLKPAVRVRFKCNE